MADSPKTPRPHPRDAHGGRSLLAAQVVYLGLGYLLIVGLGRTLDPREFGWYAIVITVVTWANIVMAQGVPPVATAAMAAEPSSAPAVWRSVVRLQLIAATAGFCALALLSPVIARILGDADIAPYLILAAAAMPGVAVLILQFARLAAMHDFGRQAVAQVVWNAVRTVGAVAFALIGGLGAALAAIALAALPAMLITGRSGLPRVPTVPLGPLARASAVAGSAALLVFVLAGFDLLVVGRMLPDQAGSYAAAQNLARVPFVLATAVSVLMLPIAAVDKVDPVRLARVWELALLVTVVPASLLIVLPGATLELVFGARYATMGPVVAILAAGHMGTGLIAVGTAYFVGRRQRRRALVLIAAGLLVGLVLVVPLTAAYGARGAAIATTIAATVSVAAGAAVLARDARKPLACIRVARIAAVVVVAAGIAATVPGPILVAIAASAVSAAIGVRLLQLPPLAAGRTDRSV